MGKETKVNRGTGRGNFILSRGEVGVRCGAVRNRAKQLGCSRDVADFKASPRDFFYILSSS